MSKKCVHCGAPLTEGEDKCRYCGSPVSADSSSFDKEGEYFTAPADSTGPTSSASATDPFSAAADKVGQVFNSLDGNGTEGEASLVLKIVSFLFPFIGLIIFLVNRKKAPAKAKSILPWVVAGVIKNLLVSSFDGSYTSLSTIGQIGKVVRFIS